MTRLAQCPSCHSEYELDDADIGHTLQCECGANLFACEAKSFPSVPLFCSSCGEQYEVEPEDIGESMECECGHIITVPDVVLRRSLSGSSSFAEADSDSVDASIACPDCQTLYDVTADDLGETAECECGCRFQISKDASGSIAAQRVSEAAAPLIIAEPDEEPQRKPARKSASGEEEKRTSWFAIIGFGSVAVFLLTAIVLFIFREKPTSTAAVPAAAPTNESEAVAPVVVASGDQTIPGQESGSDTAEHELVNSSTPAASQASANEDAQTIASSDATATSNPQTPSQVAPAAKTKAKFKLPKPEPPRPFVPIIPARPTGYTFERAFRECFAAYEETTKKENDAKLSKTAEDIQAYHTQLGKTLGLMHQAHEIGMKSGETTQIHELRYLMAYLHLTAGHLAEAAIFGQAVARWGDKKQPATLEAAMIALTAMQEANATHWGVAENVAELHQMQSIADVIAKRWPEQPQLGVIWMSLAQRYGSFGYPEEAETAYAKVPESSEHYAAAQLAAGQSIWSRYLERSAAAGDNDEKLAKMLANATRRMKNAAEALQSENLVPTKKLLATKLTLARMAMRAGDAEEAVHWIVAPPAALADSITVTKDQADEERVVVTPEFFRVTYETLFRARSQLKDLDGAQAALQQLSETLGPDAASGLNQIFIGVATDYIADLLAAETVTAEQVKELAELMAPLTQQEASLNYSNVLWMGESWSKIAERAATPALSVECFETAAEIYQRAMERDDFPADSRQSGYLRRVELLRGAGRQSEAIEMIENVLQDTPNAFGLQIEAAYALQEKALADGKPLDLLSAINGPVDEAGKPTGSAIWGWGKLVATLYDVRYSDSATEKSKQQFLEAQYNLVRCQWLIAQATEDAGSKEAKRRDVASQLKKIMATTSTDSEPWYSRLKQLGDEVSAE